MNWWIIGYVAAFIYCWWWFARIIYNEQMEEPGFMTGGDWTSVFFLGAILSAFWPLIFASRVSYILWKRYVPPGSGKMIVPKLFPKVNEVQSYRDRQAAKLDKRTEKLEQRERWVRERELDLIEAHKGGAI